jgi:hypothetical protein
MSSFVTTDKDKLTDVLAEAIDLLAWLDEPTRNTGYDEDGLHRDRILRNLVAALERTGQ